MEKTTLSFSNTLKDSITIGLKNAPSIIGCVVLWIITIWIPYINVGTTIALSTLPIELSKGKIISPGAIFDAKYRKYMGEYFMTVGLMYIPILLAMLFMVIPGIILTITWSLAVFFLLDKGKNPTAAIVASNEATYGSKWAIFGVMIVLYVAWFIAYWILTAVFNLIGVQLLTTLVMIACAVVLVSVMLAAQASVYRQLKDNVE